MFVYDFDCPQNWVDRFQKFVAPNVHVLSQEIRCRADWELAGSDVRMSEPEPPAPVKDAVMKKISDDFRQSRFRAFHATRLIRPDAILEEGLRALNRRRQIEQVLGAYPAEVSDPRIKKRLETCKNWSEDTCTSNSRYREGDCWLVPSRKLLHDGGLDCQFSRFGGEFIERISSDPFRVANQSDLEPGLATVVVAVIPTVWCWQALDTGPDRILYETMASLGHEFHGRSPPSWDVKVSRDIPQENIEFVCDREDERVAAPPDHA